MHTHTHTHTHTRTYVYTHAHTDGCFDPQPCFEQLLYSGVFEAVSIRKQGFPFRLKHDVFAKRYGTCTTPVTPL
jgi:myosin heavy subunit